MRTSFWIVSETRNRFECGSVQMKCASVRRTLFRPLSFLRHIARSSCDSGLAITQLAGGDRNRSQLRQNEMEAVGTRVRTGAKRFSKNKEKQARGMRVGCYSAVAP